MGVAEMSQQIREVQFAGLRCLARSFFTDVSTRFRATVNARASLPGEIKPVDTRKGVL